MGDRRTAWLAWALCGLAICVAIGLFVTDLLSPNPSSDLLLNDALFVLFIPLLFPNGQPLTPRWRWVSRVAIAWAAVFILMVTLSQQIEAATTPNLLLDNPIGILGKDSSGLLSGTWIAGLMILVVLCVTALFVRYRRANETERKQINWLLYASAVFLIVYVGSFVTVNNATGFVANLWKVLFGLSLGAFSAAIGIAILRHGLYDIDIIIRRTLVYSTLTLTLGLVYIGLIVLLQQLAAPVSGSSELTIVASTLAIAALFTPLRLRIQNLIDKRFYRRKYDAAKVLAAFGVAARDETDLDALNAELMWVVDTTVQPEFVGLWLRKAER